MYREYDKRYLGIQSGLQFLVTGVSGNFYLNTNPNNYSSSGNVESTGTNLQNQIISFVRTGDLPFYNAFNYSSLSSAVSVIGDKTATLVISGITNITNNLTIPANINLVFTNSGMLNVSNGATGTILGPITAANNKKIFNNVLSGQGAIIFSTAVVANNAIDKYFLPWWGVPGSFSTDAQPYIQTAIDSLPDNAFLYDPNIQNYAISGTILIKLKHGLNLMTSRINPFDNPNGGFRWDGPAGGTMLFLDRAYKCKVQGWTFSAGGTGGADRIINIDGYSAEGISSQNTVTDNYLILAKRTGAKGISISETVSNNNEFMTMVRNNIQGGGYRTGYGIWMGASSNAHGHMMINNNFTQLNHGIHMLGGSFQMEGQNNFGDDYVDMWIGDVNYPTIIRGADSENSAQFLYFNGANNTLLIESNRITTPGISGSGIMEFGVTAKYVKVCNNDITNAVNGSYIYDGRTNNSNLSLITENNRYPDLYVPTIRNKSNNIYKNIFFLVSNELGAITSPIRARGVVDSNHNLERPPIIFDYLQSGTYGENLCFTPQSGAMEWDGTDLYMTQNEGPTRRQLVYSTGITGADYFVRNLGITGRGTNNYVAKFTNAGTGIIISSIFDTGNVGIGTTTPREKLDVNGSFRIPRYRHYSMFRAVPYGSGAFSELGYFSLNATDAPEGGQGGSLISRITLQHDYGYDANATSSKIYDFVKIYDDFSPLGWHKLVPILSRGPRNGDESASYINLEVSGGAVNNTYLRLRTFPGSGGGNCVVNIECYDDLPFTQTSYTGLDTGIVLAYSTTPLTSYGGRVGIKTEKPITIAALDVSGDIYALGGKVLTTLNSGSLQQNLEFSGGYLYGLINASSAGVISVNSASGTLTINGAGNVSVTTASQTITVSGNTGFLSSYYSVSNPNNFSNSGNVELTGTTLQNQITSIKAGTGVFIQNSNLNGLISTGSADLRYIQTGCSGEFIKNSNLAGFVNSGLLESTGTALQNQINTERNKNTVTGVSVSGGISITGAVNINAGSNITLTQAGANTFSIASSAGGGSTILNGITGLGTLNYIPKFIGSSGLNNSSIFDTGNVGIGTITPREKLEVNGNIKMPYANFISISKTVGGITGAYNQFGNFNLAGTQGQLILDMNVSITAGGIGDTVKNYKFIKTYDYINPVIWTEIIPLYSSGPRTNQDFVLESSGAASNISYFRLKSISNNSSWTDVTAHINIGCYENVPFEETSVTGIDTGVYSTYILSPLTQYVGRVGIKTSKPISAAALDVSGDIYALGGKVLTSQSINGLATSGNVEATGTSLQNQVTSIKNGTGVFIQNSNLNGLITTGAGDLRYLQTGCSGEFLKNNNLNGLISTGSADLRYLTSGASGQFYLKSNPNNFSSSGNVETTGTSLQNQITNALSTKVTGVSVSGGIAITGVFNINAGANISLNQQGLNTLQLNASIPQGFITTGDANRVYLKSGDGQVVYTTGAQSINGNKTFADFATFSQYIKVPYIQNLSASEAKVDLANSKIVNEDTTTPLDWGNRSLKDSNDITTLDWENKQLTGIWNAEGLRISGQPVIPGAGSSTNINGLISTGDADLRYVDRINEQSVTGIKRFVNQIFVSGQPVEYYKPTLNYTGTNTVNNAFINWASGNFFKFTLTGDCNFYHTGFRDGQSITVSLGNTGNNFYSGFWFPYIHWPYGVVPAQSSGNKQDVYTFIRCGTGILANVVSSFNNYNF